MIFPRFKALGLKLPGLVGGIQVCDFTQKFTLGAYIDIVTYK